MKVRWSIIRYASLVSLPREFLLFKFQFDEDLQKVIKMGPWFTGKKGLVIKRREKAFFLESTNFNIIPTWISLPKLPPSCWYPCIIGIIMKVIGYFITIERWTRWKFEFIDARFMINLDISKPMMKEIKFILKYGRE